MCPLSAIFPVPLPTPLLHKRTYVKRTFKCTCKLGAMKVRFESRQSKGECMKRTNLKMSENEHYPLSNYNKYNTSEWCLTSIDQIARHKRHKCHEEKLEVTRTRYFYVNCLDIETSDACSMQFFVTRISSATNQERPMTILHVYSFLHARFACLDYSLCSILVGLFGRFSSENSYQ